MVSVELPLLVIDVGLKLTVAPDGWPLTANPMLPVNPFWAVAVTV
jgi:hypothetical protein